MTPRLVPADKDNLSRSEREIYEALPPREQALYLSSLPPRQLAEPNRKKQRQVQDRIMVLTRLAEACEEECRRLRGVWTRLERGLDLDLREELRALKVKGATVTFQRLQPKAPASAPAPVADAPPDGAETAATPPHGDILPIDAFLNAANDNGA